MHMRIVADNSEADIERNRLAGEVEATLRLSAANLVRIIRGAGKPHELLGTTFAFVDAAARLLELPGGGIALQRCLEAMRLLAFPTEVGDYDVKAPIYARNRMIRGALQIVAARLLDQRLQESAGVDELNDGVQQWNSYREELLAARKAELRSQPAAPASKRGKKQQAVKRGDA
jgi:hypothetical protein